MSKFAAYKCDGCGKVEAATKKSIKRSYYGGGYRHSHYEDRPPTGWVSVSVPGKRGHVCSSNCVELFASNAVKDATEKARAAFKKQKEKEAKAAAKEAKAATKRGRG